MVVMAALLVVAPVARTQAATNEPGETTNITTAVAPVPDRAQVWPTEHQRHHLSNETLVAEEAEWSARHANIKLLWPAAIVTILVFGLIADLIIIKRNRD